MAKIKQYDKLTEQLNIETYFDYFNRLSLIAQSIFKYENLPNFINEKWIERYLFEYGSCVFFNDRNLGFIVTKFNNVGNLNNYDEPTQIRPFGTNYTTDENLINNENCVIIRNNALSVPTVNTVNLYAIRLTEISRTIDVNINAQKTPVLIKCSDKQKLVLKNAYKQWDGNSPVIFADKSLDMATFNVLKTDAPIVFDKLQIQKNMIWNEIMTVLGINNANMDKKERLVDDEVRANNEQVEICADVMLKSRELAVEQINNLFGLNIKVTKRTQNKANTGELEGVIE